ncbi:hypothetical protein L6164_036920 [Bauhinia variegata]|uniref:Uncharacterized protein n=1 Tax=Bauhinia variegata TaxID=167791 RepID=A0ACB9KII3_BAUVA|nr:hypothetical protein L6164_036920 [Bauhinia variegata]
MKLAVENMMGTLFYVQVDKDATIADLKREIEAHQNLPGHRIILILDTDHGALVNKEEEKALLVDHGVQDGSLIYIFFTPFDNQSTIHFKVYWLQATYGLPDSVTKKHI